MVSATVSGDARFRVSPVELDRDGPSYTVDTLRALAAERPEARLFLIMGIDQFRTVEQWHRPDEIRRLATLVVMDREGASVATEASSDEPAAAGEGTADATTRGPGTEDGEVIPVDVTRVDVSSTGVRAAIRRGDPVDDVVHPDVARIIAREGLYGSAER